VDNWLLTWGAITVNVLVTAQDGDHDRSSTAVEVARLAAAHRSQSNEHHDYGNVRYLRGERDQWWRSCQLHRAGAVVLLPCSATDSDPVVGGNGVVKVTATGTTGVCAVPVTGLTSGTNYSFKAYATNSFNRILLGGNICHFDECECPSRRSDPKHRHPQPRLFQHYAQFARVTVTTVSVSFTLTASHRSRALRVRFNDGAFGDVISGQASPWTPWSLNFREQSDGHPHDRPGRHHPRCLRPLNIFRMGAPRRFHANQRKPDAHNGYLGRRSDRRWLELPVTARGIVYAPAAADGDPQDDPG